MSGVARPQRTGYRMSISGKGTGFNERQIADVPEEPGVFALSQYNITTYIGSTDTSIRAELLRLLSGEDGACTSTATWVKYEVTPAERATGYREELLEEFRSENGALPRCNDLSSWVGADPSGRRGGGGGE
jgi:hypothetical protein